MRNESRAVYFQHKYVVDNPYLATLHELHLALMAYGVNREADAGAGVYVSRLREETKVERHTLHITRGLRWIEAGDALPCAWVVPLPLLHKADQLGE